MKSSPRTVPSSPQNTSQRQIEEDIHTVADSVPAAIESLYMQAQCSSVRIQCCNKQLLTVVYQLLNWSKPVLHAHTKVLAWCCFSTTTNSFIPTSVLQLSTEYSRIQREAKYSVATITDFHQSEWLI